MELNEDSDIRDRADIPARDLYASSGRI